jgi:hypothetical protein
VNTQSFCSALRFARRDPRFSRVLFVLCFTLRLAANGNGVEGRVLGFGGLQSLEGLCWSLGFGDVSGEVGLVLLAGTLCCGLPVKPVLCRILIGIVPLSKFMSYHACEQERDAIVLLRCISCTVISFTTFRAKATHIIIIVIIQVHISQIPS